MATCNGETYLAEQLESIISQLTDKDEIVISDDHSEDQTLAVIGKFQEQFPHITVLQGPGQGVGKNFEHAVMACSGDIICFSDQDDIWLEGKADVIRKEFATDPSISVILHNGRHFDEGSGKMINRYQPGLLANILFSSYWGCCMAVRRDDIMQFLPVRTKKIIAHDQLIGAVSEKYRRTRFLDLNLIRHRVHGTNQTFKRPIPERIRFRLELFREYRSCIRNRHRKA